MISTIEFDIYVTRDLFITNVGIFYHKPQDLFRYYLFPYEIYALKSSSPKIYSLLETIFLFYFCAIEAQWFEIFLLLSRSIYDYLRLLRSIR